MNQLRMLTQQRVMKPEVVHPVLADDGEALTLFDCGDPELAQTLVDEITQQGFEPSRLKNVIVTHHDLDHVGGLRGLLDIFPDVTVYATEEQAGYIRGEKRWLRLQKEDWDYLALPPEQRIPSGRVRAQQYQFFLPGRVDRYVAGGDILPICGGAEIVDTPWHMPGHISVYIRAEKALICGDAFNTFDGTLDLNRKVDLCPECTKAELEKFLTLDVRTVFGYHGGMLSLYDGEFRRHIERLMQTV